MFQGPPEIDELNYKPLETDLKQISGVVLSHAHLDHCGRLPLLEKQGFSGDVYMTKPTAELTELSLLDSANIGREDHPEKILYDKTDVTKLVKKFKTVEYNQEFKIGDYKIILRDAGHIIGSASVEVEVENHKIVFSGDLGNTPEDLPQPTVNIQLADTVVMETTYGDRLHPPGEPENIFQSEINQIEESGGTLLIPAFSLERTQEILHIISHLKSQNLVKSDTPVYLDSPMAIKATGIYEKYKSYLNEEVKRDFLISNPFNFPGLNIIREHKESLALDENTGPQVIIAGSGMMTGGRIVQHAKKLLILGNTRLLIVGYQGEGTLGRQILNGEINVEIERQKIHINAEINDTQVMSSHADQNQLINWLRVIKGVSKVVLTHGEEKQRREFAERIRRELKITEVLVPKLNEEIDI